MQVSVYKYGIDGDWFFEISVGGKSVESWLCRGSLSWREANDIANRRAGIHNSGDSQHSRDDNYDPPAENFRDYTGNDW